MCNCYRRCCCCCGCGNNNANTGCRCCCHGCGNGCGNNGANTTLSPCSTAYARALAREVLALPACNESGNAGADTGCGCGCGCNGGAAVLPDYPVTLPSYPDQPADGGCGCGCGGSAPSGSICGCFFPSFCRL